MIRLMESQAAKASSNRRLLTTSAFPAPLVSI
jgi:hypothetical protein